MKRGEPLKLRLRGLARAAVDGAGEVAVAALVRRLDAAQRDREVRRGV
jgi:hypothetical protein